MSNLGENLKGALGLFNGGQFFEAHEALEDLWREVAVSDPARRHFQGLVQLAVAFHHESRGNLRGAGSVLERAKRNLEGADASFRELDLERLRCEMAEWQAYLAHTAERPAAPQIVWRKVP